MTQKLLLNPKTKSLILLLSIFQIYSAHCATQTFSNPTLITIRDNTTATPYPSAITVSGFDPGTKICKVTATITGLTHTFPDDIRILLVSPAGKTVMLMGRVGGGHPGVDNVNLTFDDNAATYITNSNPPSGIYKPSTNGDFPLNSSLQAPAPAAPYGGGTIATNLMSQFIGDNPNGTWNLFIVDDEAQDFGTVNGGWSITFTIGCSDIVVALREKYC